MQHAEKITVPSSISAKLQRHGVGKPSKQAALSAVENFVQISRLSSFVSRLSFCIGRLTEASAKKHGFETVTSDETTMDSLVKKIVEYYTMGENA